VLILYRLVRWRKIKWHYFLWEYCYVVNYFTLVYFAVCLLKKHVPTLQFLHVLDSFGQEFFRVAYSYAMGPLALSILAFRNGLVFHSLEHLTILAVHFGPAAAIYGMRWYPAELEADFPDTFHFDVKYENSHLFKDLFIRPVMYYMLLWSIPYALMMFYFRAERIKEKGYHTMYSIYEQSLDSVIGVLGPSLRPVLYMAMHAVLSYMAFLLTPFLWRSFWLNTAYLIALITFSIWNASTYYFEVFSVKYQLQHANKAVSNDGDAKSYTDSKSN
jgi:hypothetical protein